MLLSEPGSTAGILKRDRQRQKDRANTIGLFLTERQRKTEDRESDRSREKERDLVKVQDADFFFSNIKMLSFLYLRLLL